MCSNGPWGQTGRASVTFVQLPYPSRTVEAQEEKLRDFTKSVITPLSLYVGNRPSKNCVGRQYRGIRLSCDYILTPYQAGSRSYASMAPCLSAKRGVLPSISTIARNLYTLPRLSIGPTIRVILRCLTFAGN